MAKDDLAVMFGLTGAPLISDDTLYNLSSYAVLLIVAFIGATPVAKNLFRKTENNRLIQVAEVAVTAAVLIMSTAYLVDGSFNPFLYFRF